MELKKKLPIGSVVILKEGTKRIMVIGYSCIDINTSQTYDYSACLYPEGLLSSDKILMFNHDQIEKVDYIGFLNLEAQLFIDRIENK